MAAEIISADEFQQWADYYLDLEDDSGAALVRVTQMLKCRREDTSTGVGAHIQKRLSEKRDVGLMAEATASSGGPLPPWQVHHTSSHTP